MVERMVDLNSIGPVLRRARTESNLTQTDVAKALGISLWTYNRLENSKRTFEVRWIPLLPEKMRQPIVKLLTERTEQHLNFLRRYSPSHPFPRVGYQRGAPVQQQVA
jgi:hypothetical protein